MEPPPPPAYQPGSDEDFDRLYRATYPKLLRTVYGVLGEAAAAEDCVQDAFVQAYRAWPRFRSERPAEAWLHRIAVNAAISHRRRRRLREVGELVRRLGRPAEPPDAADTAAAADIVRALAAMPPKLSAAFILRHYHGYTGRELAAILGVSERTVGLRLKEARRRLQVSLGAAWAAEVPNSAASGVNRRQVESDA